MQQSKGGSSKGIQPPRKPVPPSKPPQTGYVPPRPPGPGKPMEEGYVPPPPPPRRTPQKH